MAEMMRFRGLSNSAIAGRRARAPGCKAIPTGQVTWTENKRVEEGLLTRYRALDLDGNGLIDRTEFGHLAESTGGGTECAIFHWLAEGTIDELFQEYADHGDKEGITFESFKRLAQDGVLLQGRLEEYHALFENVPSYRLERDSMFGSVHMDDVAGLAARLEKPLCSGDAAKLVNEFCAKRVCRLDEDRLAFEEFLNLFRDHLLDLQQITDYIKLRDIPLPEYSPQELEDAAKCIPEAANGVFIINSSEQLDAFLTLYPDKVVVLLAGLSWCRPCKSLTRPIEKMAEHYKDGAVFLKVMGDLNNNTKRLFKNRLKVKATPHISYHHKGLNAYSRAGANKGKLEAGVRRFYNTDKYPLPPQPLYRLPA